MKPKPITIIHRSILLHCFVKDQCFECLLTKLLRRYASSFPNSIQSFPNSSTGCWARSEPLPQFMESTGQYLSQPQQTRSGCAGCIGNFLAIWLRIKYSNKSPSGHWCAPGIAAGTRSTDAYLFIRFAGKNDHRGQYKKRRENKQHTDPCDQHDKPPGTFYGAQRPAMPAF